MADSPNKTSRSPAWILGGVFLAGAAVIGGEIMTRQDLSRIASREFSQQGYSVIPSTHTQKYDAALTFDTNGHGTVTESHAEYCVGLKPAKDDGQSHFGCVAGPYSGGRLWSPFVTKVYEGAPPASMSSMPELTLPSVRSPSP